MRNSQFEFLKTKIASCKLHLEVARSSRSMELRAIAIRNLFRSYTSIEAFLPFVIVTEEERLSLNKLIDELRTEVLPFIPNDDEPYG